MSNGCLIDTTKCVGCRGCQVACKRVCALGAEDTEFFAGSGGYQNPAALSCNTYSLVTFHEIRDGGSDLRWRFAKRQCMHCLDPACASACLVGALEKTPEGPVVYHDEKCIGCRYCMLACPFDVPTFEWDKPVPYIRKCKGCSDRFQEQRYVSAATQVDARVGDATVNDQPLSPEALERHRRTQRMPACAKACPTGALQFGEREELLAEAKRRIAEEPGKYINHVYGEHEAGGTSMLYLSDVPFEQLGFPTDVGTRPYPLYTKVAMESVPAVMLAVGALLTGAYWVSQRRTEREAQMAAHDAADTEKGESDET